MDQHAPDVSNTAWGHKYFSLLFPDKLDDYHNPNYQRFYLIKLLQKPPEEDGRYADWLSDIKRLSGMDNIKNEPNPTEYKPAEPGSTDSNPQNL